MPMIATTTRKIESQRQDDKPADERDNSTYNINHNPANEKNQLLVGVKFRKRAVFGVSHQRDEKENWNDVSDDGHGLVFFRVLPRPFVCFCSSIYSPPFRFKFLAFIY